MTKTYILSEISDVVKIATKLPDSWFRGHPEKYENLTPKIFRKNNYILCQIKKTFELSIIEEFKRKAPSLSKEIPNSDNHLSWLFLMQHYGTPTRLLDWTESALIALYFAVYKNSSENSNEDGELWAMYPLKLNEECGLKGLPLLHNSILRFIAEQPLTYDPEGLAKKLGIEDSKGKATIPTLPIAFRPPMNFQRMVSQMSTFTIHPNPITENTIPELLPDERHLVRYIIPKEYKNELKDGLKALGITHHTLFPDLDSLSKSIIEEQKKYLEGGYIIPEPPECGGEYES